MICNNLLRCCFALTLMASSKVVSGRRGQSPGLANDLRTAWGGLVFPAAGILHIRDLENSTIAPRSSIHCAVGSHSSQLSPDSPVRTSRPRVTGSTSVPGGVPPMPSTSAGRAPSPSPTGVQPSIWKLQHNHTGNSFFDEWDFFAAPDPTHGNVEYLDEATARSSNLVSVNDAGHAIMAVDTTPVVTGNRRSVRITTKYQFTGGLLILDAVHAPTGCGTWPAFWSNGPNWPNNGEIDILEGVNDVSVNQASIHTAPGCHISSSQPDNDATGTLVGGSDCASAESNNGGCGQQATSMSNTYGPSFNDNGGGVYAMLWDQDGVAVYFFPRQSIPPDISALAPQPQTWVTPFARWPAGNCNPFQFFQQHWAIFDTTLCGDWAGGVWGTVGAPGQEQSCAERTGFASCTEFVQKSGSSFAQAYWEVRSVRLYQKV